MKNCDRLNRAASVSTAIALMASTIAVAPLPAMAQAQSPQMNAAGQVCQTFVSNAMPYGYVGVDNVNLGAVFSSIDTINGMISGTRTTGASTMTIPASPPAGKWRNQGYKVPAWGPTGGWTSYTEYLGGAPSGTPLMQTDVIDVRFGRDDGINPGKAQVPQGVQGLYVVQRNQTGHAPLKLAIQKFTLTICGAPKTVAQLPDCGAGSTNLGQQCYGYLIEYAPNTYPPGTGHYQDSFSWSTLPSSYPNIPRCTDPALGPQAKPCMHKYKWVKVTPINSSPQVANPLTSVEVFPPD